MLSLATLRKSENSMAEKQTYREVMPGELPCEVPECDGVMVVDPDNSYKLTCDKCGHIKE